MRQTLWAVTVCFNSRFRIAVMPNTCGRSSPEGNCNGNRGCRRTLSGTNCPHAICHSCCWLDVRLCLSLRRDGFTGQRSALETETVSVLNRTTLLLLLDSKSKKPHPTG